jgi:hypothetical protein
MINSCTAAARQMQDCTARKKMYTRRSLAILNACVYNLQSINDIGLNLIYRLMWFLSYIYGKVERSSGQEMANWKIVLKISKSIIEMRTQIGTGRLKLKSDLDVSRDGMVDSRSFLV